jgi:hypothetical protein
MAKKGQAWTRPIIFVRLNSLLGDRGRKKMKERKKERKKAYLELWGLLLNNFQNLWALLPLFFLLQKQVTKDIYLYRQTLLTYSYRQNLPKKQNLNFLSIIPKDESLTNHCFHHNPFWSVFSQLPKVENNHFAWNIHHDFYSINFSFSFRNDFAIPPWFLPFRRNQFAFSPSTLQFPS